MKTATKMAAQGDVLFVRIDEVPAAARKRAEAAQHVVAHSETGHHHVVRGKGVEVYDDSDNPLVSYLRFRGPSQRVEHLRSHDTHETLELLARTDELLQRIGAEIGQAEAPVSTWKIVRQRQQTPEGWQRVVD